MLKLGSQSSVWEQEQRTAIQPGDRILVRNAQPTGYRTAWDAAALSRQRMGTVVNVDPASALVILSDGTVVRVSQATKVRLEGQPLTLSQLRRGDEVVIIGTIRPVATSGDTCGMAMPGPRSPMRPFFTATFDASEIHLMRRHQAP